MCLWALQVQFLKSIFLVTLCSAMPDGLCENPYTVAERVDGILEPWQVAIPTEYKSHSELWEIVDLLHQIPITPLPNPMKEGTEDWRETMTIGKYDFSDSWAEYVEVLRDYGLLLKSEFEYIRDEESSELPPWRSCGATIIIEISPTFDYPSLVFDTTIFANGRVHSAVFDSDERPELNQST